MAPRVISMKRTRRGSGRAAAFTGSPCRLSRSELRGGMKLSYLVVALVALALGWFAAVQRERAARPAGAPVQCPMHPWIQGVGAGKCTICGMDLVPMSAAAHASVNAVLLS